MSQDEIVVEDDSGMSIELCPEHGAWFAIGCARCLSDLDAIDAAMADEPRYTITAKGKSMLEGK